MAHDDHRITILTKMKIKTEKAKRWRRKNLELLDVHIFTSNSAAVNSADFILYSQQKSILKNYLAIHTKFKRKKKFLMK